MRLRASPFYPLRVRSDAYDPLQALEREAARLDEPGLDAATRSARRRGLLLDLEAEGLFARAPSAALREGAAGHPRLAGWLEAAQRLWTYYGSEERAEEMETPAPGRLLEGLVSVDWFRLPGERPPGWSELAWTAACEDLFRWALEEGAAEGRPVEMRTEHGVYLIRGRRDDGERRVMVRTERWRR